MRRLSAASLLVACTALGAAERPPQSQLERDRITSVLGALDHKDCARAAARLNEGLAEKLPGVYLLAGAMYEDGLCLKANWDRAATMYQRALATGHRGGLYKLVAGLAYRQRDPAAALWWSHEGRIAGLPQDCRVPDAVHQNAESFVATLRVWPTGRLAQCSYTVGVLAMVAGDAEYPAMAVGMQLVGKVEMNFAPAQGTIEWRTVEIEEQPFDGLVNGDLQRDRGSRKARDTLRTHLQEVGERALQRYERPPSINPEWRIRQTYVFNIE